MNSLARKTFKFVFVVLFLDLLAFTLILPLLPKILDHYATTDKSGLYTSFYKNVEILQSALKVPQSHNQVLLAGILGSWFSLLQFLSSPLFGALSDKFGRKPLLLLAILGSIVSYATWFAASENFALFVLSRTIGGLSKASVALSLAVISDVSDESSRGKGMAIVGSSFSLAFITGPILGAYLSTMATGQQIENQLFTRPSSIATVLSALVLLLILFFFEETNPCKTAATKRTISPLESSTRPRTAKPSAFSYVNPKALFKFNLATAQNLQQQEILKRSGLIYFYYLLFYSGLEFTLSFLTHIKFGFSPMDQGKLYLFSGSLMAIIQGGYIRRVKGGKEAKLALIGLVSIVPSFVLMGLATSVSHIYYSLTLYSFSSAIIVPCMTTIVASQSSETTRGVIMGTFRSIGALARALGPCLASILFWTLGPVRCYLLGAFALTIPLYLMKDLHSLLESTSNNEAKKTLLFSNPSKAKAN